MLFDKIASVFLFEKYIYIFALEMVISWNQHCASCIGALSFPICSISVSYLFTYLLTIARRER